MSDYAVSVVAEDEAPFRRAVLDAGGRVVPLGSETRGLVWANSGAADRLRPAMERAPRLDWVQLPSAGIEAYTASGPLSLGLLWTSAKGAFAEPVAEHALLLALAGLRGIRTRAVAHSWGTPAGESLHGRSVLVVGGGGIARELIRILQPFGARIVVLRRHATDALEGADSTVGPDDLMAQLAVADLVILCAALTAETRAMISLEQLRAMPAHAVLVNVARGGLIDTAALLVALGEGRLAGVGLDVTDPEPLPDGHPLWEVERVLITPHTADTPEMTTRLLAERVGRNVRRRIDGIPLEGVVDVALGY